MKQTSEVKLELGKHVYNGLFIGGLVWIVFAFVMIFRTIYSNRFIENMNPDLNVPFYSYDYWLTLIVSLVILLIIGSLIGLVVYWIRTKLKH